MTKKKKRKKQGKLWPQLFLRFADDKFYFTYFHSFEFEIVINRKSGSLTLWQGRYHKVLV